MTRERLEEIADAAKLLLEFKKDVYGWKADKEKAEVFMKAPQMIEAFPDGEISDRGGNVYPYEFSAEAFGVRFYTILSKEEKDGLGRS